MKHWSTVLDIVQMGIEGQPEKCREYAHLWEQQLEKEGEVHLLSRLRQILSGTKGKLLFLQEEPFQPSLCHQCVIHERETPAVLQCPHCHSWYCQEHWDMHQAIWKKYWKYKGEEYD